MKSDGSKRNLRAINAAVGRNGRINSYLTSSEPFKGFVCTWPRFRVLPPPTKTVAHVEAFTEGSSHSG